MKIALILLFITPLSWSASFRVLEKSPTQRLIQFTDTALVGRFLEGAVTAAQLNSALQSGYEEALRVLFQCSSLSDPVITAECAQRLGRVESLTLMTEDPWVRVDSPANAFIVNYHEAIIGVESGVAPALKAFFNTDVRPSRNLPNTAIYTPALKQRLKERLLWLKDPALLPTALQSAHCEAQVLQDSLTLNPGAVRLDPRYDQEKCDRFLMETLASLPAPRLAEDHEAPYPEVDPRYRETLALFTTDDALNAFANFLTRVFRRGDNLNTVYVTMAHWGLPPMLTPLIQSTEILSQLNSFSRQPAPQGVSYDGVLGVHLYQDETLRNRLVLLLQLILSRQTAFKALVLKEEKQELFADRNSEDPTSRLELIDLLGNLWYRELNHYTESAGAEMKPYLKELLQFATGHSTTLAHPLYVHPRGVNQKDIKLSCAFDTSPMADIKDDSASEVAVLNHHFFSFEEIWQQPQFSRELVCADEKFLLKGELREEAAIEPPRPLTFEDGRVDILVPYSMTSEMSGKFKLMLKTYFKALGFKVSSRRIPDLKDYLHKTLNTVDVLMPAGHSLSSSDLSIGTQKSELLILTRKKRRHEKYGVRFLITLPIKDSTPDTWKLAELAELYAQRFSLGLDPLMVFVISCHSSSNLNTWSLIYRKALSLSPDPHRSFPYVFASERGFPTNSALEIASNIFFTSDLADQLAQGRTPDEVHRYFRQEKYTTFWQELRQRVRERWFPRASSFLSEDGQIGQFEPVYNLSDERREGSLKLGGLNFKLFHENELIMDESL